jgi:uncharacterized protein (TIGR00730 family)
MKVCVCGGINPAANKKFYNAVVEIASSFCDNDIELVWGGNMHGVLSVLYNEYVRRKKHNTLVMPKVYKDDLKGMTTDKVIITKKISERSDKMFALADAIIFVPGGIGTIYEFWTAVECLRAGEIHAQIILYNYDNFFKDQLAFFDFINENGFTKTGVGGAPYKIEPTALFSVVTTPKQLFDKLQLGK